VTTLILSISSYHAYSAAVLNSIVGENIQS
jgi:hypothetical protein